MITWTLHTTETAPEKSRETLERLAKSGVNSHMLAILAESPAVLNGYWGFASELLQHGNLKPAEQMLVMLSVSALHECRYCVPVYSLNGAKMGLPTEAITAVRKGDPIQDSRLETLRKTTQSLVRNRGRVSSEELDAFFAAGFTKAASARCAGRHRAQDLDQLFNAVLGCSARRVPR